MKALAFAVRSLRRQPGRAALGILGIAAVGALLFDMLLLSRGLVVSFRDLLDSVGFDVRVTSTDAAPLGGPRLPHASAIARELAALPEIAEAIPVRMTDAEISAPGNRRLTFSLMGVDIARARRPWTLIAGQELGVANQDAKPSLLASPALARLLKVSPGDEIAVRAICVQDRAAQEPVRFRVSGIADFPFEDASQLSAASSRAAVMAACGEAGSDEADVVLIASRDGSGPDAAVAAIRRQRPDLHPATNEQVVAQMQSSGFTYFRQISAVLSTITMLFGFLLITVLLTVSVNQRLAEIAAVRALGFSRARVAADVLWQAVLLVGCGAAVSLPLGLALSIWLDAILKAIPGIPAALHFFVFEPRALALHGALLAVTALLAAVYPMWLVATLPIATTLRNEVVS
jgi:ABC-type lipoprotein release transport system permease subunit